VRPFRYQVSTEAGAAVRAVAADPDATFLGGGTNLVDHLRLGVATPSTLVDVTAATSAEITDHNGGVSVGAAVRNSDLAADQRIRRDYPVVAQAVLAGASGQIRNMATTGGNVLQRTRCVYFQDITTPCNKRTPGSGCSAIDGYTRYHAILGTSQHCVATHPSDLAVALAAVDAQVRLMGPAGERHLPFVALHRLPGDRPELDTVLAHGELITAIDLPALPAGSRSTYVKIRDRASYAFALVSVAAVLTVGDGVVQEVRIALGGVAHKPWRAHRAEDSLRGASADTESFTAAADAELTDAAALSGVDGGNRFKLDLVRRLLIMVLTDLTEAA
jgi:xanthine dehydrogenase YagS FAD-binding subunit